MESTEKTQMKEDRNGSRSEEDSSTHQVTDDVSDACLGLRSGAEGSPGQSGLCLSPTDDWRGVSTVVQRREGPLEGVAECPQRTVVESLWRTSQSTGAAETVTLMTVVATSHGPRQHGTPEVSAERVCSRVPHLPEWGKVSTPWHWCPGGAEGSSLFSFHSRSRLYFRGRERASFRS